MTQQQLKRILKNTEKIKVKVIQKLQIHQQKTFFSLDTNVTDEVQSLNEENYVYINNLIDEVNLVATDREFSVFWLIISGRELNDIAKIFNLTVQRIRQIFDETIEKLFY